MSGRINRRTVDLSLYPNLVVIYLGMRVNPLMGIKTLLGFAPKISNAVAAKPAGLLLHESIVFSLFPPHVGMRQYWRDFESLEAWSRSEPHKLWWQAFLRDSGGTGFWHETYSMRGGIEANLRRYARADWHDAFRAGYRRSRPHVFRPDASEVGGRSQRARHRFPRTRHDWALGGHS